MPPFLGNVDVGIALCGVTRSRWLVHDLAEPFNHSHGHPSNGVIRYVQSKMAPSRIATLAIQSTVSAARAEVSGKRA